MPSFREHLVQAGSNWRALQIISATDCFDWQIIMCFYSAYHVLQAHFAKLGKHHSTHREVSMAIRPEDKKAKTRLKTDVFTAYEELQILSRRARYLFDSRNPDKSKATPINETHAAMAIRHLNTIIVYFSKKYHLSLEKITLTNPGVAAELKKSLDYFEVVNK